MKNILQNAETGHESTVTVDMQKKTNGSNHIKGFQIAESKKELKLIEIWSSMYEINRSINNVRDINLYLFCQGLLPAL